MEQEIADFKKFKEDAEYIISQEENKDAYMEEESLASDDDYTDLDLLEYKARNWKIVVNDKVDKRTFQKVIKNGKELKLDTGGLLESLERIDEESENYELKLSKIIFSSHTKFDLKNAENVIKEGVDMVIAPKQTLIKAITQYKR